MKNVVITLCMMLFFCFLSYSQQSKTQSYDEPLDLDNWGKYDKFSEREQVLENMINTLTTVYKIKTFYKSNYPPGFSKEAFKLSFLQSKSNSSEKKNLENEILFVFNKLQSKGNTKTQITKKMVFNSMLEMAFEPELDGMAKIAYNGKLNKQPPSQVALPMYNEARYQLIRFELKRCQQAYHMCLALLTGPLSLQGDLLLAATGPIFQQGSTTISLVNAGIGTFAAAVAIVITARGGFGTCKRDAQRCNGVAFGL